MENETIKVLDKCSILFLIEGDVIVQKKENETNFTAF